MPDTVPSSEFQEFPIVSQPSRAEKSSCNKNELSHSVKRRTENSTANTPSDQCALLALHWFAGVNTNTCIIAVQNYCAAAQTKQSWLSVNFLSGPANYKESHPSAAVLWKQLTGEFNSDVIQDRPIKRDCRATK